MIAFDDKGSEHFARRILNTPRDDGFRGQSFNQLLHKTSLRNQSMNVLFICSQNMLRSPTAEKVFAEYLGLTTRSAGTAEDAEKPVTAGMIEWAEMVFAMENLHHRLLHERFSTLLEGKPVITLCIRDDFEYMDPELVEILKARVPAHLPIRTLV